MTRYILVIDDKEGVRDSFLLAMEGKGVNVDTATTGNEGLEKAKKNRPAIIFLDIKMPGDSGIEIMRRLARDIPGVPIYIITAFHQEYMYELERLRAEGIPFEICRKPIGRDQILAIVDSVIGR